MTSGAAIVTLGTPRFTTRLQEAEVVGDDAVLAPQARLGVRRGGDAHHAAFVAKAERAVAQAEAFDGVDEARRPAAAAELAVGHARQADRFLEGDDLADAVVLHLAELSLRYLLRFAAARGLDQALRAHETADVLGVEGRLHVLPRYHASMSTTLTAMLSDS